METFYHPVFQVLPSASKLKLNEIQRQCIARITVVVKIKAKMNKLFWKEAFGLFHVFVQINKVGCFPISIFQRARIPDVAYHILIIHELLQQTDLVVSWLEEDNVANLEEICHLLVRTIERP